MRLNVAIRLTACCPYFFRSHISSAKYSFRSNVLSAKCPLDLGFVSHLSFGHLSFGHMSVRSFVSRQYVLLATCPSAICPFDYLSFGHLSYPHNTDIITSSHHNKTFRLPLPHYTKPQPHHRQTTITSHLTIITPPS